MRILHVVTMLERGGAQFNTILSVEEMRRRGYEVWMAASPGDLSEAARRRLGGAYIEMGGEVDLDEITGTESRKRFTTSAMVRAPAPLRDAAAYRSLGRLMRELRPDIVHTHSSKAGILGRWAARRAGVPYIVHTAHGWGFNPLQDPVTRRAYVLAERLTARITDRIVTVANAGAEQALSLGIGRPEQFVTIRSAVAAPVSMSRAAARDRLGLSADALVVAWLGNFKPQKGPLDMARLAVRLTAARPNLHFLAAGDGEQRPEVEKLIAGAERVRLLGWSTRPQELLAAADMLVHTAYFEGLPRALVEALLAGLPVVTTNVDGIPELIKDGENGWLFKPGDIEGLANAVLMLNDDAVRRGRMAAVAAKSVPEEFTLPRMFDELERLYRELAA